MTALIGIGGNLGDPRENLTEALSLLNKVFHIEKKSSLYRTAAVGGTPNQPDCYNAVLEIQPNGTPQDTLSELHKIERKLGRVREEKWAPRIIDLDLLDQDGLVIAGDDLILPHPMMHERAFVLVPLAEIAPEWEHPIICVSAEILLGKLSPEDKAVILSTEEWPR